MLTIFSGRRRLRDRGIVWKESYGEKSKNVKRKFNKILPGSYFRWEGLDTESGHPYYVVVGPSVSKKYGKSFFAGVKRMPINKKKKAYSPSGKYFPNLQSALAHANKMWGTPFPQEAQPYSKSDIENIEIPKHIKG